VNARTADPPQGRIVREPDGRTPAGTLLESAMALAGSAAPAPSRAERLAALERAVNRYHALGVTSVDHIAAGPDDVDLLAELLRGGRLPIRVRVALPLGDDLDLAERLRREHAGPFLSVGFLKGFVDGVVESSTAFLVDPYTGGTGRGEPQIPRTRLLDLVERAHARGFQVGLHAVGDAAVRLCLDAFQHAARRHPGRSLRHRIEHVEVIHRDDLHRFARLGAVASMQPLHAVPAVPDPDAGPWAANLGPSRLPLTFAWRDLLAHGAVLAFGSDWPVASPDPLAGLAVALTRRDAHGRPPRGWNVHQAISADQAVAAYTAGPAFAAHRDHEVGRVTPGRLADLIVLGPGVDMARPATLWTGSVRYVVVDGVARAGAGGAGEPSGLAPRHTPRSRVREAGASGWPRPDPRP
jgi:predicted amidohydrolase YtcJ